MHSTPIEQVRHEELCGKKSDQDEKLKASTSNLKRYYCPHCEKEMWLSNIDILRHRKQHS